MSSLDSKPAHVALDPDRPTRAQWLSFAAAWLGWVLDAFDFTIFLWVTPQIAKEFGVGFTATMWSLTLTLLLRLLGGVAAGWAADRFGRKLPLMISVVWFAVCDGAVALAPSFTWVLVLRTLFGFGMGAEWTSGATLAMENWPKKSRGIASGVLQGSWAVGFLLASVASWYVVPRWGWRPLFALAALPALLVLPIRAFVPESPSWEKGKRPPSASWREVAHRDVIRRIGWAAAVMAMGFGIYYGMTGMYSPMLQGEHGLSPQQAFLLGVPFNVGMLLGAVGTGYLASKRGVPTAIILPALLMLLALPLYVGFIRPLLGVGAFLGGLLGAGIAGVTPLLLTALFPERIRARCVGIVYHLGALPAAFVSVPVAALHERAGWPVSQLMAAVVGTCLLAITALLLFRPRWFNRELAGADSPANVPTLQTEVAH